MSVQNQEEFTSNSWRPSVISAWDSANAELQVQIPSKISPNSKNDIRVVDVENVITNSSKRSLNESLAIDSPVHIRDGSTISDNTSNKMDDITFHPKVDLSINISTSLLMSRAEQFRAKRSLFSHRYKRYSSPHTSINLSTKDSNHLSPTISRNASINQTRLSERSAQLELSFEDFMKNQEVFLLYPLKNLQSRISLSTSMESGSFIQDAKQLKNQAANKEREIIERKSLEFQKMKMEAILIDTERRRKQESHKTIQAACRGFLARKRANKVRVFAAIETLKHHLRMYVIKRRYQKLRNATLMVQAIFRRIRDLRIRRAEESNTKQVQKVKEEHSFVPIDAAKPVSKEQRPNSVVMPVNSSTIDKSKISALKSKLSLIKATKGNKEKQTEIVQKPIQEKIQAESKIPKPANVQIQPPLPLSVSTAQVASKVKRKLNFNQVSPILRQYLIGVYRGYRDRKLFTSKYVNNIRNTIKDLEAFLEQLKAQTTSKDIEFQQQLHAEVTTKKKEIYEIFFGNHQARNAILAGMSARTNVNISRDETVRKSIPIKASLSRNRAVSAPQMENTSFSSPEKGNRSTSPETSDNSKKGPFPFLKRTSKIPDPVRLNWENVKPMVSSRLELQKLKQKLDEEANEADRKLTRSASKNKAEVVKGASKPSEPKKESPRQIKKESPRKVSVSKIPRKRESSPDHKSLKSKLHRKSDQKQIEKAPKESISQDEPKQLLKQTGIQSKVNSEQETSIESQFQTLYGVKLGEKAPSLPNPAIFKKDPKSKIPQLTPAFFQTYSEELYTQHMPDMLDINKPNSLSFWPRKATM